MTDKPTGWPDNDIGFAERRHGPFIVRVSGGYNKFAGRVLDNKIVLTTDDINYELEIDMTPEEAREMSETLRETAYALLRAVEAVEKAGRTKQ